MEQITSRKNKIVSHLKALAADGAYRRKTGEFVLDGEKLLREAIMCRAEIACVLWGGDRTLELSADTSEYTCSLEIMQGVSPLKSSHGPVFSVKIPDRTRAGASAVSVADEYLHAASAIILENVQDPGNVGTVIRTADAMGMSIVILVGDCADLYSPKTARATMGAIFRQRVEEMSLSELKDYVNQNKLHLYGAALSDKARDIRQLDKSSLAVAIGSEGSGLSDELLACCEGQLIIPMQPACESLNAAVAASIVMWEMYRSKNQ